jgi:rubrerythrin
VLQLLYWWVWRDPGRRSRKLLQFAETEADGGRDIVRAAELTHDPILRRLYLAHAADEQRHARLFRQRGLELRKTLGSAGEGRFQAQWLTPGERGLDDLRVDGERDDTLLAFLHLSEKSAANGFAAYRNVLDHDPETSEMFQEILKDENFHMSYTLSQLGRVSPARKTWILWRARLSRLWKGYLRVAAAIAGVFGTALLTVQYFVLLPPFALLAKRAAKKEPEGWHVTAPESKAALKSQY